MSRKTPILLRRAPLTGGVMALHRYTKKTVRGREVLDTGIDGKQDVTGDFDALVLEELMPDPGDSIIAELDGAARGFELTEAERQVIAAFRERLIAIVERHNARLEARDAA